MVVAYGKILPQAVLDIPPLGCINVHGSLLPKYRGAAPIQWAVGMAFSCSLWKALVPAFPIALSH